MELVLDIGNSRLKGAFFEKGVLIHDFSIASTPLDPETFKSIIESKNIDAIVISSVNPPAEKIVVALLEQKKLRFSLLSSLSLKITLAVDEPHAVGGDRIANVYGALSHFPLNDCLVIDIGTAITFDYVGKEGCYKGGAIIPGLDMSSKALAEMTHSLPLIRFAKPPSPLGKTTQTHIQSGLYYGLLGAVERLVAELIATSESPSSVKVIATGGILASEENPLAEDL